MPAYIRARMIDEDRNTPFVRSTPKAKLPVTRPAAPPAGGLSSGVRRPSIPALVSMPPKGLGSPPSRTTSHDNPAGRRIEELAVQTLGGYQQAARYLYKDAARAHMDDDDAPRWGRDESAWHDYPQGERDNQVADHGLDQLPLDEDEAYGFWIVGGKPQRAQFSNAASVSQQTDFQPNAISRLVQLALLDVFYGVHLTSDLGQGLNDWSAVAVNNVYRAVTSTAGKFESYADAYLPAYNDLPSWVLFYQVMGPIDVHLSSQNELDGKPITWSASTDVSFGADGTRYGRINVYAIRADDYEQNQQESAWFEYNLVHEFGHALSARTHRIPEDGISLEGVIRNSTDNQPIFNNEGWGGRLHGTWNQYGSFTRQSPTTSPSETWADMFLFWVYDQFDATSAGRDRQKWVDESFDDIVNAANRRNVGLSSLLGRATDQGFVYTFTDEHLNMRVAGQPISSIPNQSAVEILGINEDRSALLVSYNSQIGWVDIDFVNLNTNRLPLITDECREWLVTGRGTSPCDPVESSAR
jgi:hypothetical protein